MIPLPERRQQILDEMPTWSDSSGDTSASSSSAVNAAAGHFASALTTSCSMEPASEGYVEEFPPMRWPR